jgi:glycosyltransferase involved in cell wall biosynthesis
VRLAADLGVTEHVRFDNRFADAGELKRYMAAADIYLTPYLNREQITSGTLACALGSGKAVVSTPFWYAEELLADGRGALVPFRDPTALSKVLGELLGHPDRRAAMENLARAYGEQMRWPDVARAYTSLFEAARRARVARFLTLRPPALTLNHVAVLTDGTGVLQHALVAVPNPCEG